MLHRTRAARGHAVHARAVDPQPVFAARVANQAEFDRIPIEARKERERACVVGDAKRRAAVCVHVVGEYGIDQQRHVAEQIVEAVRLL